MMRTSLFDSVPGFDQPIAVLKHCHGRIRKQIATLQKLLVHLPTFGANPEAQQAANAVLRYFEVAAPHHHADEEQDLLPVLQALAQDDDARLIREILPQILQEHHQMDALWPPLAGQLKEIASGRSAELDAQNVKLFSEMYSAHMEKEETHIAPMALRLFSAEQMTALGQAMQARRKITE
jgi:pyridoxamine 5'-phosphate oxidase